MILVGHYDSPFVRRVAVTLYTYGLRFDRNRLSVFQPGMVEINPLVRIPSLIIDGEETLIDSVAILDYLDELVGPERALVPWSGEERRRVMQAIVLATGAIEKAGAIVYERHFHLAGCVSHHWVARCLGQLAGALTALDGHAKNPWYFGNRMTQVDVTIGCLMSYLRIRLDEAIPLGRYPMIEALAARCEKLDAFTKAKPLPDEIMPAR